MTSRAAAVLTGRVAAVLMTCVVVACAGRAEGQEPPAPAIDRAAFDHWLTGMREEARTRGVRPETLDRALTGLQPVPQVLERDRQQAEFTLDLPEYLKRRLTPDAVRSARRLLKTHRSLTSRIEKTYGVDPRVQIAVWGLESNFGRFSGVRPSIPTLATLAFDGRRADLFRGELVDALTIVDRGDIELEHLRGSWAGALGQVQFLPSSYLAWAVDFDKDGRRDIWASLPDVFASIANYLHGHGWTAGVPWGYRVSVPEGAMASVASVPSRTEGCRALRDLSEPRSLADWKTLGVTAAEGVTLPKSGGQASLLRLDDRTWLVTGNYEALLAYNCAHSYAISVAMLADRLPRK